MIGLFKCYKFRKLLLSENKNLGSLINFVQGIRSFVLLSFFKLLLSDTYCKIKRKYLQIYCSTWLH